MISFSRIARIKVRVQGVWLITTPLLSPVPSESVVLVVLFSISCSRGEATVIKLKIGSTESVCATCRLCLEECLVLMNCARSCASVAHAKASLSFLAI